MSVRIDDPEFAAPRSDQGDRLRGLHAAAQRPTSAARRPDNQRRAGARERSAAPTPYALREPRSAAIARFYNCNSGALRNTVARHAHAAPATVEDACQAAWLVLLARPDIDLDQGGLKWLTVVAVHEVWRQGSRAREIPAGGSLSVASGEMPEPGTMAEPSALCDDPGDRVLAGERHCERVADFAQLAPRERRDLFLHGAGFSYRQIAALTASRYTAVNRRISEGRARLRELEEDRQTRRTS